MNFLKKLFGKGQDAAAEAGETVSHVASEAAHHMEESVEEAKEAMHDAAEGTMAEGTVDAVLGEDKQ